jgi:hypothetical protein
MKKEEEIRLQILRESREIREDTGLGYPNDQVANEIAVDMIRKGLVIGSESESGFACITGIREAGLEYLENRKPFRKVIALGGRIVFVLYSLVLLAIGYILNLDSVKTFLSNFIGRFLK